MKKFTKIIAAALVAALAASLAACGGKAASSTASEAPSASGSVSAQAEVVVKIGVVGENNEAWIPVIEKVKEEGIIIELVKFADYTLPNQALADGEIDLNAFQHYAFLNNEIADKGFELTPIAETILAPLGLYSQKITSIDELKDKDKIAIPSDATNGGRALKLLESAGIIKVDPAAGYLPEVSDITENPLNLQFFEVEAAQTAALLPDVAAAIINGGHAIDNGLIPAQDAIYLEQVQQGSDNPYINIIVARTAEKDSEVFRKIVEAYHTDEVAAQIEKSYKGAYIPAWTK